MQKKIPMRQCVGGRGDRSGFPRQGAGAWGLCVPQSGVPEAAMKSKALERGFETQIPESVYAALLARMEEGEGHGG